MQILSWIMLGVSAANDLAWSVWNYYRSDDPPDRRAPMLLLGATIVIGVVGLIEGHLNPYYAGTMFYVAVALSANQLITRRSLVDNILWTLVGLSGWPLVLVGFMVDFRHSADGIVMVGAAILVLLLLAISHSRSNTSFLGKLTGWELAAVVLLGIETLAVGLIGIAI